MRTLTASFLALTLLAGSALAAGEGWHEDYDSALAAAREQKKDLLVEFTGSDWCPPCKQLYAAVFSKPEFATAVADRYVLVKLDFPRSAEVKAKVPNPERNDAVRKEFAVTGYPTVLFMTTDGDVYGKSVGYGGQDLDGYVQFVGEQFTQNRAKVGEVRELAARFEASEGDARLALVPVARELMASLGDSPLAARLAPAVRFGMEADPENKHGHLSAGLASLLAAGLATNSEMERAIELDGDNRLNLAEQVVLARLQGARSQKDAGKALDVLDGVLAKGSLSKERGREILMTAVMWSARMLKDTERAGRYADALKAMFPGDGEIEAFLESVLSA